MYRRNMGKSRRPYRFNIGKHWLVAPIGEKNRPDYQSDVLDRNTVPFRTYELNDLR